MNKFYLRQPAGWLHVIVLLVLLSGVANGQQKTAGIQGTVKDAGGQPAPAVTVMVKGTRKGAVTDGSGMYHINNISPGNYHLLVKCVGFLPQERVINIASGEQLTADFTIEKDLRVLQEIQVNSGYNKFAKKETYNVAKLPLKNLENPQVYNVVPRELLQDQVIMSYNDVLKNVTGVSQSMVNGINSFNLRGFATTSFLRDGMQQAIVNSMEVANIERIEVLKGPSATLFGSMYTSYGGMLNRVTKKPFETFKGEVSYTAGGYGLGRFTLDINTPLNKEKGLFLRTNAAYHTENSFQDAGFTRRLFLSPSLLYKVNDRLSFLVDADIYFQKSNDYRYFVPEASFTRKTPRDLGIDYRKSYTNDDLYETKPSASFFAEARYKISNQWTSRTTMSHTNGSDEGYQVRNEIIRDSVMKRTPSNLRVNDTYMALQQNFNGDFKIGGLRNRIVLGLDYFSYRSNSSAFYLYGFDSVLIRGKDPRYNELTVPVLSAALATKKFVRARSGENTYSAYVSDVLNITDNLNVMASVRLHYYVNDGIYNLTTDTIAQSAYHQTSLSPKFGAVYEIVKDKLSVFGNYMNGFSNNTPYMQPDGTLSSFTPSYANQWETGIKAELFDGKLSSTLSYYHIRVDDVVHYDNTPGRTLYKVQNGGQLSKGIEAEVIANPFKGFNLIAGYAYNDIYTINNNPDVDGLRQWSGPANTANLWLSYHFTNTAVKGLGFGIGGNYNGKAYIKQSRSQGEFYLPEYTVLNAVLSYEQRAYRISLKMDNLTNEVYWGSYFIQMMPRRFSAGVALRFE